MGEHLLRELGSAGVGTYFENPAPGLEQLDARDETAVAQLLRSLRPEVVYLTAAEPNVDLCEREPEATAQMNVGVAEAVSRAVTGIGARLVFFSTDYVFDGAAGPYAEDDEPNPLSEYGRQKLAGERWALETPGALVVRTAVVYGWEKQGKNFVARLIEADRDGAHWRVPVDQIGSPTYAPNLAAAVVELATSGASGIYHVAGAQPAGRYEFAVEATRVFGLDNVELEAVETSELGQVALRPLSAALYVDKAQSHLDETTLLAYPAGLRAMAQAR